MLAVRRGFVLVVFSWLALGLALSLALLMTFGVLLEFSPAQATWAALAWLLALSFAILCLRFRLRRG